MKEYKRLTKKDEVYGNYVQNELSELNEPSVAVSCYGKIHGTVINRLAELEDKIENGTLIACSSYEGVMSKLKDEYIRGGKETAEKFYEFAKAWFEYDEQNDYFEEVKNLAKQYGIEVEQ